MKRQRSLVSLTALVWWVCVCVSHKKQTQNLKTSDKQTVNIQRCPQCVFFLPRQVCIYRMFTVKRLKSQPWFLTRQLDRCHPDATSAVHCCVRGAFASFQRKDHSNRRRGKPVTAVLGTFVWAPVKSTCRAKYIAHFWGIVWITHRKSIFSCKNSAKCNFNQYSAN